MSTLNGIALAAVSVVLLGMVAQDREPGRRMRSHLESLVDEMDHTVLLSVANRAPLDLEAFGSRIREMQGTLNGRGRDARGAAAAIGEYEAAVKRLASSSAAAEVDGAAREQHALEEFRGAKRSLHSALAALPANQYPAWIDEAIPLAPWAFAWVIALTLVTLFEAYRLRSTLSVPLMRLTEAAAAVSAGKLHVEMPQIKGDTEINVLAESVRVMRDRLAETIARIDQRNEQMSTILANLDDGVLHVDSRGRVRERNVRASRLLEEVVLRAPEVGDNLREFLPTLPEQWLIPGQDTQREITFGREGRSERFLLIKTTPVAGLGKADDGDRGFVVVVRDVTQSKEVDMLKRDFLSVVTHELKTPLTAIEGYTKLLLMGKGGELNEKQIRFLGTIKEQTTTLNTMIQDLLDITRLEAGRLPLSMADLGAKEVIEEAFEAHAGGAQTRGLSMRLDVSKVEGVKFRADPFRLQQVLGNLIGNAFKFTPKGGEVALIGGSDDKSVWFSVSDTGRGIPAEAIPQLFGKFYQVQRGDTRVAGGAGLGLYISKQLTEAQGGEIDVTSTEGVGSIFTVRFSNGDVPAAVERDTLE